MRPLIGFTLFIALSCAGIASATQTTFPAKSCAACTAIQMQTMAKNTMPLGVAFVYDLTGHVIRKYDVYMDSTCGGQPVPQTHSGDRQQTRDASGGGTDCGSFKSADEMTPVDPDVQAVFNNLYYTYVHDYQLAANGEIIHYGVPTDPTHNQPFNLQNVAWDYPNASYEDFMREINSIFSDRTSMNNWDPGTGDYLFGYEANSFHVGIVISVPPAVEGQVSFDRNGTIHVSICTDNAGSPGDCAKLDITVQSGNVSITFRGIFNKDNDIYPSANGTAPGNLSQWPFRRGNGSADHFADEMRNHGVYIPSSGYCSPGTHPFLTTTRQNNQIMFQVWSCEQN